jgi:hypothetical protein
MTKLSGIDGTISILNEHLAGVLDCILVGNTISPEQLQYSINLCLNGRRLRFGSHWISNQKICITFTVCYLRVDAKTVVQEDLGTKIARVLPLVDPQSTAEGSARLKEQMRHLYTAGDNFDEANDTLFHHKKCFGRDGLYEQLRVKDQLVGSRGAYGLHERRQISLEPRYGEDPVTRLCEDLIKTNESMLYIHNVLHNIIGDHFKSKNTEFGGMVNNPFKKYIEDGGYWNGESYFQRTSSFDHLIPLSDDNESQNRVDEQDPIIDQLNSNIEMPEACIASRKRKREQEQQSPSASPSESTSRSPSGSKLEEESDLLEVIEQEEEGEGEERVVDDEAALLSNTNPMLLGVADTTLTATVDRGSNRDSLREPVALADDDYRKIIKARILVSNPHLDN